MNDQELKQLMLEDLAQIIQSASSMRVKILKFEIENPASKHLMSVFVEHTIKGAIELQDKICQ